MSLFPPLTAAPETPQDRLDRLVSRIHSNSRNSFDQMVNIHNEWITMVWYHFEFDPQTVVDALSGGDSVKFFTYTQNLRTYLLSVMNNEGVLPELSGNLMYPTSAYVLSGNTVVITPDPFVGP